MILSGAPPLRRRPPPGPKGPQPTQGVWRPSLKGSPCYYLRRHSHASISAQCRRNSSTVVGAFGSTRSRTLAHRVKYEDAVRKRVGPTAPVEGPSIEAGWLALSPLVQVEVSSEEPGFP